MAFDGIRARMATLVDVVVLVVAADDGVKSQTQEVIRHARKNAVPLVVAINKMDTAGADAERVKAQLQENGVEVEDFGGDTLAVEVVANSKRKEKNNLQSLVEAILLQSEMMELQAFDEGPAEGTVLEVEVKKGLGPVMTMIMENGSLRKNDVLVVGNTLCRVKSLRTCNGKMVKEITPSTVAEVSGLKQLPLAGDRCVQVSDEKAAQRLILEAERKEIEKREALSAPVRNKEEVSNASDDEQEGNESEQEGDAEAAERVTLRTVIRADVAGSLNALESEFRKIATKSDKFTAEVVRAGVGPVTSSDVELASTFGAEIFAFNVGTDTPARMKARKAAVPIRKHRVIYDLFNEVQQLIRDKLPTIKSEVVLGTARVQQLFPFGMGRGRAQRRSTNVGGAAMLSGTLHKSATIRVMRNGEEVHSAKGVDHLRRFKDNVASVTTGQEFGITLIGFEFQEGDEVHVIGVEETPQQVEVVSNSG